MFNSYISTVLPELGEENVKQTTFQKYLEDHIEREFEVEDPFTQMEYVLTKIEDDNYKVRLEGIKYKASLQFITAMDRYITFLKQEGMQFKDIQFKGKVIISKEQIKEKFYEFDSAIRIPNRIKLISEWLLKELRKKEKVERKKLWVEEEIQLLDKETYLKVHQQLQKEKAYSGGTFNEFEREQSMLADMVVKEHFIPLRRRVKKLQFIHTKALYTQLFQDPNYITQFLDREELPENWWAICKQTVEKVKHFYMPYEDATPYLYMKDQIQELQRNTAVKHIFIDEAQDYSTFQYAFLKRIFPHTKMTILGDFNQTIYEQATNHLFSQLNDLYGEERSEKIVLKRDYRSTKQIIEFTKQFIPHSEEIEPFERDGRKPVMIEVKEWEKYDKQIAEGIDDLKKRGHRTIAVICKTEEESKVVYNRFQQLQNVHLIKKETSSFDSGILVIPSYLSKGIEFDAVIIYDASQYKREKERNLFYTVCTRAMHELMIYNKGEINPFLQSVSQKKYELES